MKEYRALEKLKKFLEENVGFSEVDRKYLVGAVALDYKGRIIGLKTNSYKTHPRMTELSRATRWGDRKIFLHAEVATLVSVSQPVHTIIIARIRKDGSLALAKPCPLCQLAIKEAKVKRTYFTNEHGELTLLKEDY